MAWSCPGLSDTWQGTSDALATGGVCMCSSWQFWMNGVLKYHVLEYSSTRTMVTLCFEISIGGQTCYSNIDFTTMADQ